MSPANDKLKGVGALFKNHLDKLLLGVMAFTLAVVAFLQFGESQTVEYDPAPPKPTTPTSAIDPEKPEYQAVMAFKQPMPPFSEFEVLVKGNMFDPKASKNTEETEKAVDAIHAEAKAAFDAGDLAKAEELVEGALRQLPTHRPSRDLRAQIKAKKAEADATAAPPGAPGAKPPTGGKP